MTSAPSHENEKLDDSEKAINSADQARTQNAADVKTSPGTTGSDAHAMHGFKLFAIFVGICFGAFLMSLDIFVIATAIPSITSDFQDTSQLACNTFIPGRAIAGIGASGVASGGFVIVLTVSPEKSKPLLLGICSSCFVLGLILAPVIGGAFTEKATWRWCFWLNLPPGALTLLSMLLFFRPPSIQRERTVVQRIKNLDVLGCAIFVPAIFVLLLAMMWGGTQMDWNSATVIGLFVGSGVMLILIVCWEGYKGESAMIPGNVITRRTVPSSCARLPLYTRNSQQSNTPSSHWIGFQVIQGLGVGMAQQMPSLIVQHTVRDRPELMPVAISLNLFFQYLGAAVTQVLGGIVFRSVLNPELADRAGLNARQIAMLSAARTANMRCVAERVFSESLDSILGAYNEDQ
ncbi:hypothetical protein N7539_005339 [Penicillium diatomitis]|uniref:Major facilitator superfamily (MFS) profile domain-containing protein n=1 Tax=Penicillium diatomitis TaxID=2819901 RepID=A0A9W9X742_9EURO|nr:uncharacterized protein N7539_005339 [Penicillium diatomitis]KAJ5485351.1 hypothetical protein N7539_005339 [Penicillium diatomitis]